jgi:hypothetical protein
LFRRDRVAGLLKKTGLDLIEVRIHGRIERIEIFAESQTVELIAPLLNCLSKGSSDAAAFVAQKREQARDVVEQIFLGAARLAEDRGVPAGCLMVQSALAVGDEAGAVRKEAAGRRAASERALRQRLQRAKREGDLPEKSIRRTLPVT